MSDREKRLKEALEYCGYSKIDFGKLFKKLKRTPKLLIKDRKREDSITIIDLNIFYSVEFNLTNEPIIMIIVN